MKIVFKSIKNVLMRTYRYIFGFGYTVTAQVWNAEYLSGKWDNLSKLNRLSRYSVIVGYIKYFKKDCSVLDVGCGEGILQERIGYEAYSKYVGIDITKEAINRAVYRQNEKTRFIVMDANDYIPSELSELFDVIVFNESLYYFDDPLKVLKIYERYLKEDGIFITSMVARRRNKTIWNRIASMYCSIDETRVTNTPGFSYICKVLVPSKHEKTNL